MISVTPSVLVTSVLNPNMRTFDVVMHTEYGTSYNSYVVLGSEKIALIEAAHARFLDVYFSHLDETLGDRIPDYLILNHTEPDHTGTVAALLDRYPNLQIVISRSGSLFLKNIVNRADLNCRIVGDGDTLDLGGKTLRFISAPFLHWPDTMFTYCPEEKVVFTCDFLGSHYCEPEIFDSKIVYPDEYASALKNYFDCIMAPFKPFVRDGLARLATLDIERACVSHGPILTRGHELGHVIECYRQWSAPGERTHLLVPVFYCSAYGNTEALAERIAAGIRTVLPEAEATPYDLIEHDLDTLGALMNASNAFALGTPTINRDALPVVWELLSRADAINLPKRPVAVFGSYGWSGEGVPHVVERLSSLKAAVFGEQLRVQFVPTAEDLEAAEKFGAAFARSLPD